MMRIFNEKIHSSSALSPYRIITLIEIGYPCNLVSKGSIA
ncbi:hypothetical protein BARBAKC583_1130 [Bartonella bacilliformis KC583]|uniref:Uncharacterized protein n=1 Tax=Bartonella bacilliformis (strain ATCC 35685 / KC583 / Herrer 020/F12,63) TaxID=360095 RepID=A1UTT8_BARBK|nr:hypothetical protein BARBAKC583_1130 [Bartonella bacilliformis KC583]